MVKQHIQRAGLALLLASVGAAPALAGSETPQTAPGAQAAVRGMLKIGGTLDLMKPDLGRAVVYIASDPKLDQEAPPKEPAIVAQRDKKFVPDFTVVARQTAVEFPNEDPFDHNVFSRSKAAPAFDLLRYPKGMSKSRVFSEPGVIQVFCNIHPSMRAIIVVTPNRYFARADAAGNFSISGVPAGHYTLVAWQERCEESRQAIDVTAQGAAGITLELHESRQGIMANEKPPTARTAYGPGHGLGVKQENLNLPAVTGAHPAPAACCGN